MGETLRRTWFRIVQWLNSDSVLPYVWVYYIWLFLFGVYAVAWSEPVQGLDDNLGPAGYMWWAWMNIIGTASVMIGLTLRHGGTPVVQMSGRQLFSDWLGLWMQWGGHAAMFLVLLVAEIAGVSEISWGDDAFVLFLLAPYMQGCLILWLTTSLKLAKAAQL